MSKPLNYTCPKCDNKTYEVAEMRATGGTLSKIFDVQNKKFTSVTCKRCSYTEFYKARTISLRINKHVISNEVRNLILLRNE